MKKLNYEEIPWGDVQEGDIIKTSPVAVTMWIVLWVQPDRIVCKSVKTGKFTKLTVEKVFRVVEE